MVKPDRRSKIPFHFHPGFFLAAAFMWYQKKLPVLLLFFLITLIHEGAHLLVGSLFKVKIKGIHVLPIGFMADMGDMGGLSSLKKCLIFLAGPAASILIAFSFRPALGFISQVIQPFVPDGIPEALTLKECLKTANTDSADCLIKLFFASNLLLGLLNLLPAYPLDGGRILSLCLTERLGYVPAVRKVCIFTYFLSALFIVLGMVLLHQSGGNPSLLIIGIFLWFYVGREARQIPILSFRDLLGRKQRILRKGIYPVKERVVLEKTSVMDLIRTMENDCFHIFRVIDRKLVTVGVLEEGNILEGLVRYGSNLTAGDLCKMLEEDRNTDNKGRNFLHKRRSRRGIQWSVKYMNTSHNGRNCRYLRGACRTVRTGRYLHRPNRRGLPNCQNWQ